jgi:hypothetical protein
MSFKDKRIEEFANLSCDIRVIAARSNVTFLNCGATMCKISHNYIFESHKFHSLFYLRLINNIRWYYIKK